MEHTMTESALEDLELNATLGDGQEAETDDHAETPDVEESASSEEQEKPKRNRLQERFSELTAQREEYRRKAEEAEDQVRRMRVQQEQDPNEAQMMQQLHYLSANKPNIDSFDTHQEWAQAYERWMATGNQLSQQLHGYRQFREQQRHQQLEQERAGRQAQENQQAMEMEKIQAAVASREDWYEVVSNPNVPPIREVSPAAFAAILDSDYFADITYHLAKHPSEVEKLAGMSPVKAVKVIADLERKIAQKPQSMTINKPPSDIPSRGGSKDPGKMDISEWMAWRNAQVRG